MQPRRADAAGRRQRTISDPYTVEHRRLRRRADPGRHSDRAGRNRPDHPHGRGRRARRRGRDELGVVAGPFLAYSSEIRKVIYSTNAIESLHARSAARCAPEVTSQTNRPR